MIKNCPDPIPVAAVHAAPHLAPPTNVAAAELIQLPPTIIRFFVAKLLTSLSLMITFPNVLSPGVIVEAPATTFTSAVTSWP